MGDAYETLVFTGGFLESLSRRDFTQADRGHVLRALRRLDTEERHPSLRIHELHGRLDGVWTASASDSHRLTFVRLPDGKKRLLTCSKHYDR